MRELGILSVLMILCMYSCSAIEGIFKAGMWVGILMVVALIVLIVVIVGKVSRKK
jgi:hypothetical protein